MLIPSNVRTQVELDAEEVNSPDQSYDRLSKVAPICEGTCISAARIALAEVPNDWVWLRDTDLIDQEGGLRF